jgi:hypothetical protein
LSPPNCPQFIFEQGHRPKVGTNSIPQVTPSGVNSCGSPVLWQDGLAARTTAVAGGATLQPGSCMPLERSDVGLPSKSSAAAFMRLPTRHFAIDPVDRNACPEDTVDGSSMPQRLARLPKRKLRLYFSTLLCFVISPGDANG